MTIQLTTIESTSSKTSAQQRAEERVTDAVIGIDLTLLGAPSGESLSAWGADLPVEHINFPRLASCVSASSSGGIDIVTLSRSFRTRSDGRGGRMDGVRTAARLAERGVGPIGVEVPADPTAIEEALGELAAVGQGASTLEISVDGTTDLAALAAPLERARGAGLRIMIRVAVRDLTDLDLAELVEYADSIRLLTNDPHESREARFALRSAAHAQGRSLPVFVEIGIIISGNISAANERALLVEAIQGSPVFAGKAHVVGTVYDVADAAESWIGLGAADGIIFLPASVPTDLASVIRGVLPLLRARGGEIDDVE